MLGWNEPKLSRFPNAEDLHDTLESVRTSLNDLAHSVGKTTGSSASQAKSFALERVDQTEELMKDNFAASILLVLGIGLVAGYFIGRSME
jgi:ElaB/YqjD/DUF883 family membrane-anchored ribosome-binding protein